MTALGRTQFTESISPLKSQHLVALCLILFLGGMAAGALPKEKHNEEVQALFERAHTVSDLEVEGGAPFRLAALVYARVVGGLVAGNYVRVWQAQDRWRDELTFPRYKQVRGSTESVMWRQRNTNHQPLPVIQFLQGLTPTEPRDPGVGRKLTIAEGLELVNPPKCVKLESSLAGLPESVKREWCFDTTSGVLTRQNWNDWDTHWEYVDYAPWNGKQYPRQINIVQDGERVVEARIRVMDAPTFDPASFAIPDDAEKWPRCESAKPPRVASSDRLLLGGPRGARRVLTPVMVEVGADGHVQDVTVLRPLPDAEREHRLFIDLKQRWKFQPATCGKEPMPMSLVFEFLL